MPVIEYHDISTLDEVDFDKLFYATMDKIGNSYSFPSFFTPEEKNIAFRKRFQDMIDGVCTMRQENETFLMRKVTLDGEDVCLMAGYIESDPTIFRNYWFLVAPDANGSRSWLYSAEYKQAMKDYYTSKGITKFRGMLVANTSNYDYVQNKQAINHLHIDSQTIQDDVKFGTDITCFIDIT